MNVAYLFCVFFAFSASCRNGNRAAAYGLHFHFDGYYVFISKPKVLVALIRTTVYACAVFAKHVGHVAIRAASKLYAAALIARTVEANRPVTILAVPDVLVFVPDISKPR